MTKTGSKKKVQDKPTSPTDSIRQPPYTGDLEDSQTARTSFRLSQEGRDSLVWLAQSHQIKYQDVFVRLVSELMTDEYMRRFQKTREPQQNSLTYQILQATKDLDPKDRDSSARATYVVNKLAVMALKNMSKKFQIPRDMLVDLALKLMREKRESEMDSNRQNSKKASNIIDKFYRHANQVESELEDFLDEDDPILRRFGLIMVIISNLHSAIESNLNDGVAIDPDDFSQSM